MKMGETQPSVIEQFLREAGVDPRLVNPGNIIAGTAELLQIKEPPQPQPEKPPKEKKEEFRWEESLLETAELLKTGRRPGTASERPRRRWPPKAAADHELASVGGRPMRPLDFSFALLEDFEDSVVPRTSKEQPRKDKNGLYLTDCVRVAHNQIASMRFLDSLLEAWVTDPSRIEWLDLSYNKICEINSKALSTMPNLKILYLHCNCLEDLDEVRQLRCKLSLRSLTLFGNPIEATTDYRLKIAAALPMLKNIDWGVVTPQEQVLAKRYTRMMKEKDEMEAAELKRQKEAAEAKIEKKLKLEEKLRKRREEEAIEAGAKIKSESKIEETQATETPDNEESEDTEGFEIQTNELEKTKSENVETPTIAEEIPEEAFEVIVPADLADPGPVDVKGKHKLNIDPLNSEVKRVSSSSSSETLFSTDTVTVEEIQQEFELLKEMEAGLDQEYY